MTKLPGPKPAVVCQRVSEGAILLDTEQEIYFGLNSVGIDVWEMLPPACTELDELCAALSKRYPAVGPDELRADVSELLAALEAQGLVVTRAA